MCFQRENINGWRPDDVIPGSFQTESPLSEEKGLLLKPTAFFRYTLTCLKMGLPHTLTLQGSFLHSDSRENRHTLNKHFLAFYSYQSSQEIQESLGILPKAVARSRRFNLVSTLRTVRERMFTANNGDRPNVPNGLIIITDTTSTDDRRRVLQETSKMAQVRPL